MVRRRSTVRFRNGAPAKRNNSNLSNRLWESFREPIGPGCSQDQDRAGIAPIPVCGAMRFGRLCLEPARLCGGSSAWRAGLTGSTGARACSAAVSRRVACRPARARRPGWSSCRSRSGGCVLDSVNSQWEHAAADEPQRRVSAGLGEEAGYGHREVGCRPAE
jgi:hypothetical protein